MTLELSVNVDHVATLRQARGAAYPDPAEAARIAEETGAHGITAHLRSDRRHIQDRDVEVLAGSVRGKLNLEMAATDEMVAVALAHRPAQVSLVPERPEELTTEGGLDLLRHGERVRAVAERLAGGRHRRLPVPRSRPAPDRRRRRPAARAGRRIRDQHRRLHQVLPRPPAERHDPPRGRRRARGDPRRGPPRRRGRSARLRRPRPDHRQRRPHRRGAGDRRAQHRPLPGLPVGLRRPRRGRARDAPRHGRRELSLHHSTSTGHVRQERSIWPNSMMES